MMMVLVEKLLNLQVKNPNYKFKSIKMKKLFIVLSCLLIFFACTTTKKVTTKNEVTTQETAISEASKVLADIKIDTSKRSSFEISHSITTYYPPPYKDSTKIVDMSNYDVQISDTPIPSSQDAIKTVETWTVKKKSKENGITEIKKDSTGTKASNSKSKVDIAISEKEKTKPISLPWKWVILIFVVGGGIYAYIKKIPVFGLIKKLFGKPGS
jgi:hypothetical protein